MDHEALYARLPRGLQSVACSLEGWRVERQRYGPLFSATLAHSEGLVRVPEEERRAWSRTRLTQVLTAASKTVFWAERFRDCAIDPQGADPYAELAKLPILAKSEIQARAADFLLDTAATSGVSSTRLLKRHTSGTTGAGLIFWETAEADAARWATWWRYRGWHGLRRGLWCGYFGGRSLVPTGQTTPPYWRINYPGRQVMFSAYHLSDDTAPAYLAEISRRGLTWLHGYPSVLALVAGYALKLGVDLSRTVRIVTTGAESLFPHQRRLLERGFGAVVREHYGQSEGVANFSECPLGRLHVDEDYAFVEFIPATEPGQYRIVGTNLTNTAFPLLRYDTQDLATLTEGPCDCGRPGRNVSAVDGRREDYLVLADGARVGRLDHILKDMVEIREAQFRQRVPGQAELHLVRGQGYDAAVEQRLWGEIRKRLGERVQIELRYVEQLERTRSGKLRFVVSEIQENRI